MVEIYNIDINTHERFARDQTAVEAFRRQYHVPSTGERAIAVQTKILDFIPKHPAIVLLLQVYQKKTWARFEVPKNYYDQRIASSYVAPSLGNSDKIKADVQKLRSFVKQRVQRKKEREEDQREDQETEEEGEVIAQLLEKGVIETNSMVDFVIAKMHQFVAA